MQNTAFVTYSPWQLNLFDRTIIGKPSAKQQAAIDAEKQKMLETAKQLALEKLKMESGVSLQEDLAKNTISTGNKNMILIAGALIMVIVFVALKMKK